MPSRIPFLNDIEIEQHIKEMDDRSLMEFTARQVYDVCLLAASNERRIVTLEKQGHKITGIAGTFGTLFGAAIVAIVDFFVKR